MAGKAAKVGGGIAAVAAVGAAMFAALAPEPPCPATMACLSWQASPGWDNGTSYAPGTVVTYKVFRTLKQPPSTDVPKLVGTTTALSMRVPNDRNITETQWFYVVAEVNTLESVPSNSASKLVRAPGPTDGRIEGPSDGAIE